MRLRDLTTPLYEVEKERLFEIARGPVGGAFGRGGAKPKKKKKKMGGAYGRPVPQPQARTGAHGMSGETDYELRIAAGRKLEADIFNRLKGMGLQVRNASKREDMYDKIDFWITIGGQEYSAQIKQREVGDDIIFEVYKDIYDQTAAPNGRDYIGKAHFYVVVTPAQRGYVVKTDAIKNVVNEFLQENGIENGFYKGAKFNITTDRATGNQKLMAFFPPDKYGKRLF